MRLTKRNAVTVAVTLRPLAPQGLLRFYALLRFSTEHPYKYPYIYNVAYKYPPLLLLIFLYRDMCYNVTTLALEGISALRSP